MTANGSAQNKNLAWLLPRPKPDRYKGGMPLHAEKWLLNLAREILNNPHAKILNIFCGMNTEGFRVDIKADVKPDLRCDAHELSEHLGTKNFNTVNAFTKSSKKSRDSKH